MIIRPRPDRRPTDVGEAALSEPGHRSEEGGAPIRRVMIRRSWVCAIDDAVEQRAA